MLMFRVRFIESFKDGQILDGRQFLANEDVVLSEQDYKKIEQSGGMITVLETLIPNPRKSEPVEAQPEPVAKAKKNAK